MNPEYVSTNETTTLKELIAKANLNQRELSKRTGIAEVTINSWVAGKKIPRFDNAVILASELGVSLEYLAKSMGIDISALPVDSPNP